VQIHIVVTTAFSRQSVCHAWNGLRLCTMPCSFDLQYLQLKFYSFLPVVLQLKTLSN